MIAHLTPGASIRNRLTALKQNRGEYIKSQDVLSIYHAVVKQGTLVPVALDVRTNPCCLFATVFSRQAQ